MTTGERIKKVRKQKGMTQKELADKLGITNNSLSRYEIGERQPPVDMLEKIANALGVQMWELLYDGNIEFNNNVEKDITEMTPEEQAEVFKKLPEALNDTTKKLREIVYEAYAQSPEPLLLYYEKLNREGKIEATKRTQELTEIEKYTKPDKGENNE
jgi:transcriptional regulator with XRE-family HTH domain